MVDFLYFSMIAIKTSKKRGYKLIPSVSPPSFSALQAHPVLPLSIWYRYQYLCKLFRNFALLFQFYLRSHPTHSKYLQSDPLYLPDQD